MKLFEIPAASSKASGKNIKVETKTIKLIEKYPCGDSNAGTRLRRAVLYPTELQGRKLNSILSQNVMVSIL